MSAVDIDSLIAEIPATLRGEDESVCGPHLEYTDEYRELIERAAPVVLNPETGEAYSPEELDTLTVGREEAERKVIWAEVKRDAITLLGRSNDIQIAEVLCRALLIEDGLAGLNAGLSVFTGLITRFWEFLYPSELPFRLNIIASLGESDPTKQGLVFHLRRVGIVYQPQLKRSFSLKDIEFAMGIKTPASGLRTEIVEREFIEEAFRATGEETLAALRQEVSACISHAVGIQALVADYGGDSNCLAELISQLEQVDRVIADRITADVSAANAEYGTNEQRTGVSIVYSNASNANGSGTPVTQGSNAAMSNGATITEVITSREDVVKQLDAICTWYQNNEPSSPVPFMLARARKTVSMNYLQIVEEISPSGLDEAKKLTGVVDGSAVTDEDTSQ